MVELLCFFHLKSNSDWSNIFKKVSALLFVHFRKKHRIVKVSAFPTKNIQTINRHGRRRGHSVPRGRYREHLSDRKLVSFGNHVRLRHSFQPRHRNTVCARSQIPLVCATSWSREFQYLAAIVSEMSLIATSDGCFTSWAQYHVGLETTAWDLSVRASRRQAYQVWQVRNTHCTPWSRLRSDRFFRHGKILKFRHDSSNRHVTN